MKKKNKFPKMTRVYARTVPAGLVSVQPLPPESEDFWEKWAMHQATKGTNFPTNR